jgi:hypothetical protein
MALALLACKGEHATPSAAAPDVIEPPPRVAPGASASTPREEAPPPPQRFSDTSDDDCAREADASVAALGLLSGCASCIAGAKRFMGKCRHDPAGAWSVALSLPMLHVTRGAANRYGFRVQVVRRPTCDAGLCFAYSSDPELAMTVDTSGDGDAGWSTYDYDHDGTPEILIRGGRGAWVLTAEKNEGVWQVVPYPPSAKLDVIGIEDVDHDGRPDLRYQGHYAAGGIFVAHSLADGKFSLEDDVATRAFAAACPPAGAELAGILGVEPNVAILRIVCARARGKSAIEVKSALATSASSAATDAGSGLPIPKSLEHAISSSPPLVLR